ncbi:hypothetical protein PG996_006148 [Apiospora saccharicola]|uniref:F-box domain-containing protein n=1 Tax=Apiospora saccharicola TaxID=335842 RepID=A0ABR1VRH3_9PEZI
MHRALLLPEIVAAIVKSESGAPGYLYTCLFINRLFSEEACRLLWYGCGSGYNSATAGHVTPGIRQLAEISQHSRQRAQVYADFINVFMFSQPKETWPYGNEAVWHGDLACLQYPQLQELTITAADDSASLNRGDVVIDYARPSLRTFALSEGSALSDAFLDELRTRCPQLKWLTLSSIDNTMTQDGLLRFLRTQVSLECVWLQTGFGRLWTEEAFHVVAQYPNLELLELYDIPDDWIRGEQRMFPALKWLYTRISPNGLVLLSRHVPSLETLHATLPSTCTSIKAIVNYPRLKDLRVSYDDGAILRKEDLLLIAENCPGLQCLEIGEACPPRAEDLDDLMIEKMAQGLPQLKEFTLIYKVNTGSKPLTLQSIKSLGRHCPHLGQLKLTCISIDWEEADNNIISDSVWTMDLLLHMDHVPLWPEDYDRHSDNDDGTHVSKEHIAEMGQRFARRFPKMSSFFLDGGGEGEEELQMAVDDITMERY